MEGIDDEDSRVGRVATVDPVEAGRDPDGATDYVLYAELILIEVVGPSVSPSDAFVDLAEMHVDIAEFCWQDIETQEVVVVLLIQIEHISNDAHPVMNDLAFFSCSMVHHVSHVLYEVTCRVR